MLRRMLLLLAMASMVALPSAALAHGATPVPGEGATVAPHNAADAPREHGVIEFDKATAVWVLIIFGLLLFILWKTAWKNVLTGLKARENRIRKDIADAEAARAKADATLKEYNTQLAAAEDRIRDMLSKAATDGEKLATSIRMKAQQEAEEIKERATKDIEGARDAALREIYEKTADLATSVAEKIIRRNLNASDQQDLVRQSLQQLQTVK